MPLPDPKPGQSRDEFVSECMRAQQDEEIDRDQKLAICFSKWRKAKGIPDKGSPARGSVSRFIRAAEEE